MHSTLNGIQLEHISLSYFYGAKIGVLGLNGAGKSSLLRIMAGVDKEFNGEMAMSPGYSVGFLEQEPDARQQQNRPPGGGGGGSGRRGPHG
jgi:ATPase subunit of ABC transporter with duplicated ATPase domains